MQQMDAEKIKFCFFLPTVTYIIKYRMLLSILYFTGLFWKSESSLELAFGKKYKNIIERVTADMGALHSFKTYFHANIISKFLRQNKYWKLTDGEE